ncbi:MAG: hypothetical protein V9G19_10820 [Tetrasphaera sp.]
MATATAKALATAKAISIPTPTATTGSPSSICPRRCKGKVFYQPSDQGYEAQIRTEVARRREAQLAAMLESDDEHGDVLTFSPDDPVRERWLQRTISGAGERLGDLRDRIFAAARPGAAQRRARSQGRVRACSPGRRCAACRKAASMPWRAAAAMPTLCARQRTNCPPSNAPP